MSEREIGFWDGAHVYFLDTYIMKFHKLLLCLSAMGTQNLHVYRFYSIFWRLKPSIFMFWQPIELNFILGFSFLWGGSAFIRLKSFEQFLQINGEVLGIFPTEK